MAEHNSLFDSAIVVSEKRIVVYTRVLGNMFDNCHQRHID